MALSGYSRKFGAHNKNVVELNFCGTVNCDEARKELVAGEVMRSQRSNIGAND
jgi:hypothetical protein